VSVHLLRGDDPSLLLDAVVRTVRELVGDADRSLVLEELDEERYRGDDGFDLARLVDAAQTPPFLTDHRVVVGRHLGRFGKADEVAPLVAYLADPLPSTRLVLVWEKGENPRQDRLPALPKSLSAALEAAGATVVDTSVPGGKKADEWLADQFRAADVKLSASARRMVGERLGEDRARVVHVLETLTGVFGPGAELDVEEVRPFLGDAGAVPPWELTDAIDSGDVPAALDKLHRMLGAGDRHALQLMATLHGHYARMLRLDGAGVHDEKAAAAVLGMKGSTFPAKKALTTARKLGGERIARAITLLAGADLDLRGVKAWPDELVLEVLVARLAALSRR
jgi:DNA polymerase-3 subunit delta